MTRSRRWILVVVAVTLVLVTATVAVGFWAKGIVDTAAAGKAHALSGARSLAAMDATAAVSEFRAAKQDFTSLTTALGSDRVSNALSSIPWAGRQYAAARSLARIGFDGSSAGLELAQALLEAPPSATADPTGRLGVVLSSGRTHIEAALNSLSDAAERANSLSADGLVPPLAESVRSIQAALRETAAFTPRIPALLKLESYLLYGSHRILIVSQDGAELRPTGGWAGSFGILTVGEAGIKLESYQDVFVLPNPPGRVPMPLGARQTNDFNFRNANWWLDFPTSAQRMLAFWREYGQPPVDGIVVIDTVVMADLLEVMGPITVPRHNETFTSENLLDRLLVLTQVERGGQPDRKNVLVELATELEKRVLAAGPSDLAKYALVVGKAADQKHVQMYFVNPGAQAAADALHWSGRVAPPQGTTDVLAISNAMNLGGKVNVAMKKTIAYEVAIQPDRSAETTLVLGYANTGPYPEELPSVFRDWLRVYRAPGTIFRAANPDGSTPTTMTEFGFPAEAHTFTLLRGQTYDDMMTSRVPRAVVAGATEGAGSTAQYRLYMVRQADLEDIPTTVTVTVPRGWRVTSARARLIASGLSLPVTVERDRALLAVPLSGDLELEVRLTPSDDRGTGTSVPGSRHSFTPSVGASGEPGASS